MMQSSLYISSLWPWPYRMGSASQLVGTVSRAFAAVVASARSDVAMSLVDVLRNIRS